MNMGCWNGCLYAFRQMIGNMRESIRPVFRRRRKNRVGVAPDHEDTGPLGRKLSVVSSALNAEVPNSYKTKFVEDGQVPGPSGIGNVPTKETIEKEIDLLAADIADKAIESAKRALEKEIAHSKTSQNC